MTNQTYNTVMVQEAARKLKYFLISGDEGFKIQGLDRLATILDPSIPLPSREDYDLIDKEHVGKILLKLVLKYDLLKV